MGSPVFEGNDAPWSCAMQLRWQAPSPAGRGGDRNGFTRKAIVQMDLLDKKEIEK